MKRNTRNFLFPLLSLMLALPALAQSGTSPVISAPRQTRETPSQPSELPPGLHPGNVGASPASDPGYHLAPDDSIQITVWKEPQLSGVYPVRPDGMISLPLLNDVHAAGLTPMELSNQLTERFKQYLQTPLVTVAVVAANSQKVYVLGEVQHVGAVDMAASMTPLQALSAAGGMTPYAKQKSVYILRGPAGHQKKIPFNYKHALKGDPNASLVLQAGDTIVVP